ncbi:MAG: polyphosphate kinase 1 [Deltaproteobacteria bacterium]|nr:polyphosphate kinase 1 [Deltaproteobacteria bacterium]
METKTDGLQSLYLNREFSRLQFESRILSLAEDTSLPLLERAKFLAIFGSNLDEFFQIRVAGLKAQIDSKMDTPSIDGLKPESQLQLIHDYVSEQHIRASSIYQKSILPELAENDIRIMKLNELSAKQASDLQDHFERDIFPVLTPLAVDPAHPFPFISNLSLNLAVLLVDRNDRSLRFARVKVPSSLPRLQPIEREHSFVLIEDVIAAHLNMLFPGMKIASQDPFRLTRDAIIDLNLRESEDLREAMESGLLKLRLSSPAVRLEIAEDMAEEVSSLLYAELGLSESDTYCQTSPLDLRHLWEVYQISRPELKSEPWVPKTPRAFSSREGGAKSIFEVLRKQDVLVHHPYESFDASVVAFLNQAADDPNVLAIKHTLYRSSGPETSLFQALARAAAAGKQVVTLVELTARFDESANIEWAQSLERSGVHVVYGLVGLKTHAKITLVVRQDGKRIRRYCHIGTGNYHPVTARIYEDVGLLTASEVIGEDLTNLFNHLTGISQEPSYRKLLVAPHSLRQELIALIHREMGLPDGRIVIKVNNLSDPEIIDELYSASRAGVQIDLIVRSVCGLRPGLPGVSENIRVRSILGGFLEHSRIYRFGAKDRGADYFIGSADLMPRNLTERVETLVPVESLDLQTRIEEILDLNLAESRNAWSLSSDGEWKAITDEPDFCAQETFMNRLSQRMDPRKEPS